MSGSNYHQHTGNPNHRTPPRYRNPAPPLPEPPSPVTPGPLFPCQDRPRSPLSVPARLFPYTAAPVPPNTAPRPPRHPAAAPDGTRSRPAAEGYCRRHESTSPSSGPACPSPPSSSSTNLFSSYSSTSTRRNRAEDTVCFAMAAPLHCCRRPARRWAHALRAGALRGKGEGALRREGGEGKGLFSSQRDWVFATFPHRKIGYWQRFLTESVVKRWNRQ